MARDSCGDSAVTRLRWMEVDFFLERRPLIRCPDQINNLGLNPSGFARISFNRIDMIPNFEHGRRTPIFIKHNP
jgi:hypothetical protein